MGTQIRLKAADGHEFDAYKAEPKGVPKGAMIVVQEIFGVNHHIRATADKYAAEGYLAIAPALFDRAQKDFEVGYTPDDIATGRGMMQKVNLADAIKDVTAAVAAAKEAGKVGIVGYCWGGTVSFAAACRVDGLSAAVSYYGGGVAGIAQEKPRCPVMFHFGDQDQSIPMEMVEKVKAAQGSQPLFVYPAGHGFNCDERGSYDAESAKLAWQRTTEFLQQNIG